jgi:DNA-binding beta-propeller fold protein YncE
MLGKHAVCLTVSMVAFVAASAGAAELKKIGTVDAPGTTFGTYDISYVDQATNRYYLADRTNKSIDVVDVKSGKLTGQISGGFVGQQKSNDTSGPNGILIVGGMVWAGDGDSTVKIINLKDNKVVDTISTGGKNRVDEMSYDPKDHVVLVANNADDPPFATLISTKPGHKVIAKVPFPDATDGAEQSVYYAPNGMFYLSIPEISKDKAKGGIAVIDPRSGKVVKTLPVDNCHPAGLVRGPGHSLLLGCTAGSKDSGLPPQFVVINADSGAVVKEIPGLGAADMVTYNPKTNQYYTASRDMPDGPELGVLDAKANTLVQQIKLPGGNPHSVAVSEANNHVFLPVGSKGGCGCIEIYAPQ